MRSNRSKLKRRQSGSNRETAAAAMRVGMMRGRVSDWLAQGWQEIMPAIRLLLFLGFSSAPR